MRGVGWGKVKLSKEMPILKGMFSFIFWAPLVIFTANWADKNAPTSHHTLNFNMHNIGPWEVWYLSEIFLKDCAKCEDAAKEWGRRSISSYNYTEFKASPLEPVSKLRKLCLLEINSFNHSWICYLKTLQSAITVKTDVATITYPKLYTIKIYSEKVKNKWWSNNLTKL